MWITGEDLEGELERSNAAEDTPAEPSLDAGLLNGSDGVRMGQNVARNLKESRMLPVIGVFDRV